MIAGVRAGSIVLVLVAGQACLLDFDGLTGGDVGSKDAGGCPDCDAAVDAGGCATCDAGADAGACPERGGRGVRVTASNGSFCIDATEVTSGAYAQFLASSPTAAGLGPRCAWKTSFEPAQWPAAHADLPVTHVDWCDALAFCAWAGKELCGAVGGGAHAPSSRNDLAVSAWYVACTRDGARAYPYGASHTQGLCQDGRASPANAGSNAGCEGGYPGIFDLSGNVEEWVDACDADSGQGDGCLARGGNFSDTATSRLACAAQASDLQPRNERGDWRGFRCCAR